VYIDYLEVAPWNWTIPQIGQVGRSSRVGRLLFFSAVRQSLSEGYGGRVGLHALPQSASFYCDACGMISLGCDDENDNLEYFELGEAQAKRMISGE